MGSIQNKKRALLKKGLSLKIDTVMKSNRMQKKRSVASSLSLQKNLSLRIGGQTNNNYDSTNNLRKGKTNNQHEILRKLKSQNDFEMIRNQTKV